MIDQCPKLLITTYTCKAKTAIREIEDLLYIYDNNIRIVETRFKDVILVYTKLNPKNAVEILKQRPPTGIAKVVRVDACVETDPNRIALKVIELFKKYKGSKFYVDCIRRGRAIKSSWELEKFIGAEIVSRNLGMVSFRDPEYVVRVEVVDTLTLISIMSKYEDKIVNRKFRQPL